MIEQKKWQRQSIKFQNNQSVYVAGLPPQTTYWDLRDAFAEFGDVCATFVSSLKPKQTHKYGFGCFKSRRSVDKLLAADRFVIHGAVITVRRRTKRDWQHQESDFYSEDSDCPPQQWKPHNMENMKPGNLVDQSLGAQCPPILWPLHNVNSLPTLSPFLQPPEFTDNVHDTLASQYCTKGLLQAVLKAPQRMLIAQEEDNDSVCQTKSINDDHRGRVARVDGIPASWEAVDLFNFLVDYGVPITNVLVYDDFDERGLRQGLIQLNSSYDAASLCSIGSFQSLNIRLQFATSCIQSIGPIRRTYAGNFTAYSREVPTAEAYGYSMAEPAEPSAEGNIKEAAPGIAMTIWPSRDNPSHQSSSSKDSVSVSPICEIETPGTVVDSDSSPRKPETGLLGRDHASEPHEPTSEPNSVLAADNVDAAEQCPTSLFSAKRSHEDMRLEPEYTSQFGGLELSKTTTMTTYRLPQNAPFCGPPHLPTIFPKASQTVIVDNFDSRLIGDRENLSNWVSQFGELQSLDLVPMDDYRTRAYISYMSPLDAQYTMHHLQMCMSGSFRLTVRLA